MQTVNTVTVKIEYGQEALVSPKVSATHLWAWPVPFPCEVRAVFADWMCQRPAFHALAFSIRYNSSEACSSSSLSFTCFSGHKQIADRHFVRRRSVRCLSKRVWVWNSVPHTWHKPYLLRNSAAPLTAHASCASAQTTPSCHWRRRCFCHMCSRNGKGRMPALRLAQRLRRMARMNFRWMWNMRMPASTPHSSAWRQPIALGRANERFGTVARHKVSHQTSKPPDRQGRARPMESPTLWAITRVEGSSWIYPKHTPNKTVHPIGDGLHPLYPGRTPPLIWSCLRSIFCSVSCRFFLGRPVDFAYELLFWELEPHVRLRQDIALQICLQLSKLQALGEVKLHICGWVIGFRQTQSLACAWTCLLDAEILVIWSGTGVCKRIAWRTKQMARAPALMALDLKRSKQSTLQKNLGSETLSKQAARAPALIPLHIWNKLEKANWPNDIRRRTIFKMKDFEIRLALNNWEDSN